MNLEIIDGDYFGVSYKQALTFLINNYNQDTLKVFCSSPAGIINKINFTSKQISKMIFVNDIKDADFYITNYYFPSNSSYYQKYWKTEYPFDQRLIFDLKFRKSKVIGIYKLERKLNELP